MKTFAAWREYHNGHFDNKCPYDLLEAADPKLLDKWMSAFIVEIRRADAHLYPPKMLDNILSRELRYIQSLPLENPPNFLAKDDPQFRKLLATRNKVYKSLRSAGVGAEALSAATLSKEELDRLWDFRILRSDTPRALVRAAFFVVGLHACLRGVKNIDLCNSAICLIIQALKGGCMLRNARRIAKEACRICHTKKSPFTSVLMQAIAVQSRSWMSIMPESPQMPLRRMQPFNYAYCLAHL